jgi:hypothetical protein
MKIRAWIEAVADNLNGLHIEARGWQDSDPSGVTGRPFVLTVANTPRNREALYIGRDLVITIEPRR